MLEVILFVVGLLFGFVFFNFVILPLFYGVPKATYWVIRGELRGAAIWYYIRVAVLWNVLLLALAILATYLFPSWGAVLYDSAGFFYGQLWSLGGLFLASLTRKGRSDLREDFWDRMRARYARTPTATTVR